MNERHAPAIVSPCVGICTLEGPYCVGCWRTMAEISRWASLSAAERERIMAELPGRRRSRPEAAGDRGPA
jgi:predicted Fe-S protein YdhL (DUF1289 family)